jgi:hypothetical protein
MVLRYVPNRPGWVLSHNINEFMKDNVPDFIPLWTSTIRPGIVSALNSNDFTKVSAVEFSGKFDEKRSLLADLAGAGYQFFCENEVLAWNPSFWIGVFLFLFTVFSFFRNSPRRAWAKKGFEVSQPVDPKTAPLTAPGMTAPRPIASPPPPRPTGPAPVNVKPKA